MQPWKIEHFGRDNPDQLFPAVEVLSEPEAGVLLTRLEHRIGLNGVDDRGMLISTLYRKAGPLQHKNAEARDFNLAAAVTELGLEPQPLVYVGGLLDLHTTIRLAFSDLSRYFEYIWYPASDDIAIFDDTLSWLLFVNHEGELYFLKIVD